MNEKVEDKFFQEEYDLALNYERKEFARDLHIEIDDFIFEVVSEVVGDDIELDEGEIRGIEKDTYNNIMKIAASQREVGRYSIRDVISYRTVADIDSETGINSLEQDSESISELKDEYGEDN